LTRWQHRDRAAKQRGRRATAPARGSGTLGRRSRHLPVSQNLDAVRVDDPGADDATELDHLVNHLDRLVDRTPRVAEVPAPQVNPGVRRRHERRCRDLLPCLRTGRWVPTSSASSARVGCWPRNVHAREMKHPRAGARPVPRTEAERPVRSRGQPRRPVERVQTAPYGPVASGVASAPPFDPRHDRIGTCELGKVRSVHEGRRRGDCQAST
jgi:hypothetical protein